MAQPMTSEPAALPAQAAPEDPGPPLSEPEFELALSGLSVDGAPHLARPALLPPLAFDRGRGPSRRRHWQSLLVGSDTVGLAASFVVGAIARQPFGQQEGPRVGTSLAHELPYLPVYVLAMALYGLYRSDGRRVRSTSFFDIGARGHAMVLGAITALGFSAGLDRFGLGPKLGWVEVFFMSAPALVLLPATRVGLCQLAKRRSGYGSRVIILGSGSVAASLARRLGRCDDIKLLGFVDDRFHATGPALLPDHLGVIADLPDLCEEMAVDRVLVAFSQTSPAWLTQVLRSLPSHVRVSVVPRLFELVTWQSQIEEIHGLTVMDVAPAHLDMFSRAVKRSLDVFASLALLLVTLPVMAVIAVAIKATSPGPVLFRQDRVGYKAVKFKILKFRTMELGADEIKLDLRDSNDVDGPLFKIHRDPRVTRLGRFLRPTSLDELPQLFNVFKGDMSLVGPRPFVPDESAGIGGWAARRFEARPGMTGLWQVSGRNDLPFEELCQLDYAYVASWSLWWDLKILWHTPGSILRRHGAY